MVLKNKEIAQALLESIGGEENIKGIRECSTRIRLRLKNASLTKEESIKRINGIIGIIEADNLYYLLLEEGLNTKVYNEILKLHPNLLVDPKDKIIPSKIKEDEDLLEDKSKKEEVKKDSSFFNKLKNMFKGKK